MYDLEEGSDTGREWIEIYNGSGNSVDILGLRLFEAKTTHKEFKIISGDGILSLGEYAIIVADDTKFYIDNPTFSGDVLDSSFSLRQKDGIGERLVIRDSEENDIDSVTYDPLWGASGDGNSLQKINGSWCAGVPTPGTINANTCASLPDNDVGDNETPPNDEEEAQEQELSSVYSSPVPSWVEELKINTYAGVRKRIIVAGASVDFSGVSAGVDEKPLLYARYVWNFGDGSIGEGKGIKHTYYYPGEYVVVLNTSSGGSTATDRVLVEVIPADIVISEAFFERPSFVEIYNKTSYELDLSKWKIKSGKQIFNIPQNTFVRAKKKIIFPEQITKLPLKEGSEISLLYSSGEIVTTYKERESASILVNKVENEIQEQKSIVEPASDYVE
ncbi:MAG: lamin tail domain-containing protein, partial [Candidatus Pacebacteria bacterium]|nr:lamin tail domain-containing protein [Candidatus Paceibacterota bacterium]